MENNMKEGAKFSNMHFFMEKNNDLLHQNDKIMVIFLKILTFI